LAKLKYSGNQTNLRITGDLLVNIIEQSGEIFLRDKKSTLSTELVLEEDNSKISIKPSDLNIAGVNLQTEGLIRVADDVDLDIRFSNEEAELNEILSIVPNSVRESFEHLDLDGSASIAGYFKGRVSDTKDPSFGFTYDIKKADINVREQGLKLKNISAHGELQVPDMGNMRSAWVKCKLNNASSGSTSIKGSIRVDNFDRPKIHWDGFAKMDARTALAVLDFKSIQAQSGQVLIDGRFDLIYDPLKEEVLPNSLHYVGRVKASGIKGKINEPNLQLHHFDLDLAAENKQMVIKSCNLKYNKTEASLIGYILNSDDLFSRNSKSEFVGELKLNGLYVNELYGESSDTAESVRAELFPFKLKLRTEIQNFRYNNFTAQSLSGTLESDKKSVFMNNCKMTALEGHSEASIRLTTIGGNYLVDINSRLEAINIRELFRQFDNFEQNEITDEHISGVLNGKIMAKVILDRNYEPLLDKLYAKADMEIFDGQLVGYEPLNELSTFVEISDLQNVRFDLLKNSIEIFDRTIYIPKMHIGNSALSLDLEGTHTFDNYMDYRLSISLMELLAGRSNWLAKKQEKRIESNAEGGLTAYLTMKGTPEDLKITYDRTTAREAFTEEVKKEKRNFMQALRNEGTREEQESLRNYNDIWDE
jgi:hypothetical protein